MSEKTYISELAGHCNEATAWRILKEASQQLIDSGQRLVSPTALVIDDEGRVTLSPSDTQPAGFDAPQCNAASRTEADAVWSLGATLFYVVMGRQVMNGKGGKGQTAASRLPYMRSEWPEMSELVQRCLQYEPALRPSLNEVLDKASRQHEKCLADIKRGPRLKPVASGNNGIEGADDELAFWPETMQTKHNNP